MTASVKPQKRTRSDATAGARLMYQKEMTSRWTAYDVSEPPLFVTVRVSLQGDHVPSICLKLRPYSG